MAASFSDIATRRAAALNDLTPEAYEAAVRSLVYRRGFLLAPSSYDPTQRVAELRAWRSVPLLDRTLLVHPDTEVAVRRGPAHELVLIGHAFDPERGRFTVAEVLDDLESALTSQDELLALLDRLAGRYRILLVQGGRARVWHDAMGSAAVFYLEGGGACASHAELLALLYGLPVREFVVPFVVSKGYRERDVKYLPGLVAPYEHVLQLTPNTVLDVDAGTVSRYWPRDPLRPGNREAAADAFRTTLEGVGRWFAATGGRPVLGLTGGTDSRGLLIGCAAQRPLIFSYARSEQGTELDTPDTRTAATLAERLGLEVLRLGVRTGGRLNAVFAPMDVAFRRSTGQVRTTSAGWLPVLAGHDVVRPGDVFVRGFGGEVLRGFYQSHSTAAARVSANQLARTYDVNSGSEVTRAAFEHFAAVTDPQAAVAMGYDPNDVLYWEHRMGVWGASAMSEADLVVASVTGYNTRRLFEAFLALDIETRASREVIHDVYRAMSPELMTVPFA